MDFKRLARAAVVAWVVDAIYGVAVWMNMMGPEYARHVGVFRPEADMNASLPLVFAGVFLAMFVLTYMYAKGYEGGGGVQEGFRFGLLLALFTFGFVSLPIYATFNIDGRLGVLASILSFIEMLIVGTVIGVMYKPAQPKAVRQAGV